MVVLILVLEVQVHVHILGLAHGRDRIHVVPGLVHVLDHLIIEDQVVEVIIVLIILDLHLLIHSTTGGLHHHRVVIGQDLHFILQGVE